MSDQHARKSEAADPLAADPLATDPLAGVISQATAQAVQWNAGIDQENQISDMVRSDGGIDFTMRFVDRVARPTDNKAAAKALHELQAPPSFISGVDRALFLAGIRLAPVLPHIVIPAAKLRLRQLVGDLILDADGSALNELLDEAQEQGIQLNLNLLGEAVLGEKESDKRLQDTIELVKNPRVSYVSIKASSVAAQLNPWDMEGNLARLKGRLRPLYRAARDNGVFVNLDMEEYKDLQVTVRLFTELLSEDEFRDYQAGIVLQAYLPDSYDALRSLATFATQRVADGGASVKVRIAKGANLSMERVEAELHDWPQAPYLTKHEVDANYYRLLDFILQPEYADSIRIGVASHNLFTMAFAKKLAAARGVERQIDMEMLQGMAPAIGEEILYTPVVRAEDFDVAVSYLVRRLEENGAEENFLHAQAVGDFEGQKAAFLSAVADRWNVADTPRRSQDRSVDKQAHAGHRGFRNEPDTDPALAVNRAWALQHLRQDPGPARSAQVTDVQLIDAAVARARDAAPLPAADRERLLHAAADALARHRGDLIAVMAYEAGKTVDQSDPEISEAIDFANYYASCIAGLDDRFTPNRVVVVIPPWNFPVAIPMGGVFAAIAAGARVILKPAPQTLRCAEVAVQALREAGITEDVLQLVNADESDAGKRLISHPEVDTVVLTGASETARLFRSWRPEMNLLAETSGKNAIIVTPHADPDLAVADAYKSAFGHAGQKCSAASLLILVGDCGRFKNQLVDAVATLRVGRGTEISTTMNGLIEAPGEKLRRGLTQLDPGESWLLQPREIAPDLWTPGIRDNVQPGSWFHTTECFGPVTGIMYASSLEEAIEWQNSTGFGLTGGLHSLDEEEIAYWREHVEVGNAYINRGITGAIVQRQSFGGWKNSAIGPGAKAGGPNYVAQFGSWEDGALSPVAGVSLAPAVTQLLRAAHLPAADLEWVTRAAELDAFAWATEFGVEHDRTGLRSESNVFRYVPADSYLYYAAELTQRDELRLKIASELTGVPLIRLRSADFPANSRIRVIGDAPEELRRLAADNGSYLLEGPLLADGRRELLLFLKEQAISQTMHRFGVIAAGAHAGR
ncbi:proline dehydrogenase family protein [Corynebacterium epidermidicanis]|uniref:L-glutamate gamma-semialdehyde dehydrogenase n=1 Tax=Corynebacterium epidermidicanis TaxID=1050174 RepID=A0A0G3GPA8_9CORY|nr:proline dehydrogenase family protein [Corynebacterium epidermidicanis]AKK02405.1 L-proline dehydrogenase [Corynebacterium epidermidicanis]